MGQILLAAPIAHESQKHTAKYASYQSLVYALIFSVKIVGVLTTVHSIE